LDLFFAERHTTGSVFELLTNVDIDLYTYQVQAVDPDGDPLTYRLVAGPKGMQIDPTTGLLTWNPDADQVGRYEIEVEVSDGRGGIDKQSFTLEVTV
jgi:Putative Ig domain